MSIFVTDPTFYDIKNYTFKTCKKTNTFMLLNLNDKKSGFDMVSCRFFDNYTKYVSSINVDDYSNPYLSKEDYVSKKSKAIFKTALKENDFLTLYTYNGDAYETRYHELPGSESDKKVTLYVPSQLSDIEILNSLENYKTEVDSSFSYDLEHAKTFLGIIGFKYIYNHTSKRKRVYADYSSYKKSLNAGFMQYGWSDMLETIGPHAIKYRDAFLSAGIILCDGQAYHFENSKKKLGYKFDSKYFENSDRNSISVYNKFNVTSYELKYRMAKLRADIKSKRKTKKILKDHEYELMKADIITLLNNVNPSAVRKAYEQDSYAYYNVPYGDVAALKKKLNDPDQIHIDAFLTTIELIQDGNSYFNVCDEFGYRFHSPITNTKSWLRQFLSVEDKIYMNIDFVNSQFACFANIIEYPEQIKKLLAPYAWESHNGKKLLSLDEILGAIGTAKGEYLEWKFYEACKKIDISTTSEEDLEKLYYSLDHFQKFADHARNGSLYDSIGAILNKDRSAGKCCAMKIIFGNEHQFYHLKKKLDAEYGDVVNLSSAFNGNDDYVNAMPKLLQMVESVIVMNIMSRFMEVKKYPVASIHDSFLICQDDYDSFMKVYKEYMKEIGLPEFKVKIEYYNHPNNQN